MKPGPDLPSRCYGMGMGYGWQTWDRIGTGLIQMFLQIHRPLIDWLSPRLGLQPRVPLPHSSRKSLELSQVRDCLAQLMGSRERTLSAFQPELQGFQAPC